MGTTPGKNTTLAWADDEWSPLYAVIVGRAEGSCFPYAPRYMLESTMPPDYLAEFKPSNPFPVEIVAKAKEELDGFAALLEGLGIRVYRPAKVNWFQEGGFTGAMPRDGLMIVGSTIVEAMFSWQCRVSEIGLAYQEILTELSNSGSARVYRAPIMMGRDTLYDGIGDDGHPEISISGRPCAINNSRPAFDTADFMRFGKTVLAQVSHMTNRKGVEYVQSVLPEGYTIEILKTNYSHASHLDSTLTPLRKGLMVYHPTRVSEQELRRHAVFQDWELLAYPFPPQARAPDSPPAYICSEWLFLNMLVLDGKRVVVEAGETKLASWLKELGMEPIMCPFQHVNSIGGSFHCATLDIGRLPVYDNGQASQ